MDKKTMAAKINSELSNFLFNLYSRWQSEKEYEDFDDYVEAFKKYIPETIKGLKRPFGFIVKCIDGNLKVTVKVVGKYLQIHFKTAK